MKESFAAAYHRWLWMLTHAEGYEHITYQRVVAHGLCSVGIGTTRSVVERMEDSFKSGSGCG